MYITGITEEDYMGNNDQQEIKVKEYVSRLEKQDTSSLMKAIYSVKRETPDAKGDVAPA